LGNSSRVGKLGAEGGHDTSRAMTSLMGHNPAVSKLGSPGSDSFHEQSSNHKGE